MKNAILAVVLFAAPAGAATLPAAKAAASNVIIEFKLKNAQREAAGRFEVGDGNQANYVAGGELTQTVKNAHGRGVEYKKHGVIVNCLPALNPDGRHVSMECQFEISGPGRKNPDAEAWDIDTFQYQAGFVAELGKPMALVDEKDRRVEITVSRAP